MPDLSWRTTLPSSTTLLCGVQGPSLIRMAASMTWMKNSSCIDLLMAARLWRPLGGKTYHWGGRWEVTRASGEVGLRRLAGVAAKAEERMGQHDQSDMSVQPGPEPAFIVVQAPGEKVFGLSLMPFQGALPDEPTFSGEGFAPTTNPVNPHSSELLGQVALAPCPPGNGLPGILGQLFQESVGLSARYSVFQVAGPSGSTLALVRWGRFFPRVPFYILGQAEASRKGYSDHMGEAPGFQTLQEQGLVPITGIG